MIDIVKIGDTTLSVGWQILVYIPLMMLFMYVLDTSLESIESDKDNDRNTKDTE